MDTPRFVFITEGKLFLQEGASAPREIESPFANAAMARAEERQNRHAWKAGGAEDQGPFNARNLWGRQAGESREDHPVFRHVTRGTKPGEIFYVLSMTASSGVFRYNLETGEEQRLFHREDFHACGLTCSPQDGRLVVASRGQDRIGDLELVDPESRRRDRVTDGEGHDAFPSHHPTRTAHGVFPIGRRGTQCRGRAGGLRPGGGVGAQLRHRRA